MAFEQHGSKLARALAAGAVGLVVNFALLLSADAVGIVTARGGFQRLVKIWFGPRLASLGAEHWWSALSLPEPSGTTFMVAFKVAVGLGMALVYAAIEPVLPGRPVTKGLVYAALVWTLNAVVVLPLLGEGFAGARSLSAIGIIAFALAHTAFFVVVACLYGDPSRSAETGLASRTPQ